MKYALVTFGCRVNQADSLQIEESLRMRGWVDAPPDAADVVVVNTCSVTAAADQGARQVVRRIARQNPEARIVVTGCYATRRPDEVAALTPAVRVVANEHKLRVASDAAAMVGPSTAERDRGGDGPCGAAIEPGAGGRTAFTLRVQTGCAERCAYCIIPSTRGRPLSLPIDAIVREVERIGGAGFRDVTLTGVHLGSYGHDLTPRRSLLDLLEALGRIAADVTFRISSLEPMDCSRELVDLVAGSRGRFAPHFHLPLQHASDRMLALMRRPYDLAYYQGLVAHIVDRLPHASIGTDMIVGFPGETDEDFDASVQYLSSAPLSHVHVFPYSDRPGTEAAAMSGKVAGTVVRERGARLRQLGARLAARFHASQAGSVRPALAIDDGTVVVTDNYLKVGVSPGVRRNERVLVRVSGDGSGTVVDVSPASPWRAAAPGTRSATIR